MKYFMTSNAITFLSEKPGESNIQILSDNDSFETVVAKKDTLSREDLIDIALNNWVNVNGYCLKIREDNIITINDKDELTYEASKALIEATKNMTCSERSELFKGLVTFIDRNIFFKEILDYIYQNSKVTDVAFSEDGECYMWREYNDIESLSLRRRGFFEPLVQVKSELNKHRVYCHVNFMPWWASGHNDVHIDPVYEDVEYFGKNFGVFNTDEYEYYAEHIAEYVYKDLTYSKFMKQFFESYSGIDYFNLRHLK